MSVSASAVERGGVAPEPHAVGSRGGRTGGRASLIEASEGLGWGRRRPGRGLLCLCAKLGAVLVAVSPVLTAAAEEDVAVGQGGGRHGGRRGRRNGDEGLRRLITHAVGHGHV